MKTLMILFFAGLLGAQVAREANTDYRDPSIRPKISASLSHESRDARQKPRELIAALGIKPGMSVADVGTGSGYMIPFLAEAVGPKGAVWVEDIFPDFIEAAKKRGAQFPNVKYVTGNEKSAELPPDSQDLILVLDAYHHFDFPEPMLANLRAALKPSGRLVVVEYHKNEKSMPNRRALEHIRSTRDEFVKEIEGFGFKAAEVKDFLPEVQWMGVFVRR